MPKHNPTGRTVLAKLTRRQKMVDEGVRFGADQGYFEPEIPAGFNFDEYLKWVEMCGGKDDPEHQQIVQRAREVVGRYRQEKAV